MHHDLLPPPALIKATHTLTQSPLRAHGSTSGEAVVITFTLEHLFTDYTPKWPLSSLWPQVRFDLLGGGFYLGFYWC